jgi:hypothetical protein
MYARLKRTGKPVMVDYKVLSWHSLVRTEKNHKRSSVMVADVLIKNQTGDLLKISRVCHS